MFKKTASEKEETICDIFVPEPNLSPWGDQQTPLTPPCDKTQ